MPASNLFSVHGSANASNPAKFWRGLVSTADFQPVCRTNVMESTTVKLKPAHPSVKARQVGDLSFSSKRRATQQVQTRLKRGLFKLLRLTVSIQTQSRLRVGEKYWKKLVAFRPFLNGSVRLAALMALSRMRALSLKKTVTENGVRGISQESL